MLILIMILLESLPLLKVAIISYQGRLHSFLGPTACPCRMGLGCSPYSELVAGWLKMVLVAHLGDLLAALLSHSALACGLGKVTTFWVS